jgi:hypothetical protein
VLGTHEAPLLLEVHPPFRPKAPELHASVSRLLDQA